jgi:O-antigen/teichoic acid export membrane protein
MARAALARSAVIWTTAFNVFRDILQFGTMLVLVRILDPALYGQFGVTTATMGFVAIFSFNNFVAHTLQVSSEEEPDYQVHFTAGIVLQGFAFLLANGVAFYFSTTEKYAPVAAPMHVASFAFLLEWPCELRRRMLERNFEWRRLNTLHAVGIFAGSLTGLAMGLSGFGIYALVGPGMFQTVPFIWDLFFVERWRPDWSWSRGRYVAAWAFGLKRTASGIAIAGRNVIESTVLSAILGYQLLGIFNRALGLMQLLCARPASILGTAIYPLLPRMAAGSSERSRAGDLILRTVGWIAVPTAVAAALLAEPIVTILYGDRWVDVIPLLPWTMAYGAAFALVQTANLLLLAGQRAGAGLVVDFFVLVGAAVGLLLALPSGMATYLAFLLGILVIVLVILAYALGQLGLASQLGLICAVGAPLIAAGGAGALAWGLMPPFAHGGALATTGYAATWMALFAFGYVTAMRVLFGSQLRELVVHLPGKRALGRILAFGDIP